MVSDPMVLLRCPSLLCTPRQAACRRRCFRSATRNAINAGGPVGTPMTASRSLAAFAALLLFPALCLAQASYPDKPIKLVVPYPPGGSTDPVARLLATDIAPRIGQPIVVDNRPGAAGSIGTEAVARAAPDGYTILLHTSVIATDPTLKKAAAYDVKRDLAPITLAVTGPYLVVVNLSLPVKNIAELIAYAKAN